MFSLWLFICSLLPHMWLSIISVAYFHHLVEKIFYILVSTILIVNINVITRIENNQLYQWWFLTVIFSYHASRPTDSYNFPLVRNISVDNAVISSLCLDYLSISDVNGNMTDVFVPIVDLIAVEDQVSGLHFWVFYYFACCFQSLCFWCGRAPARYCWWTDLFSVWVSWKFSSGR